MEDECRIDFCQTSERMLAEIGFQTNNPPDSPRRYRLNCRDSAYGVRKACQLTFAFQRVIKRA